MMVVLGGWLQKGSFMHVESWEIVIDSLSNKLLRLPPDYSIHLNFNSNLSHAVMYTALNIKTQRNFSEQLQPKYLLMHLVQIRS